jgi:hypothetical protein
MKLNPHPWPRIVNPKGDERVIIIRSHKMPGYPMSVEVCPPDSKGIVEYHA